MEMFQNHWFWLSIKQPDLNTKVSIYVNCVCMYAAYLHTFDYWPVHACVLLSNIILFAFSLFSPPFSFFAVSFHASFFQAVSETCYSSLDDMKKKHDNNRYAISPDLLTYTNTHTIRLPLTYISYNFVLLHVGYISSLHQQARHPL